MKVAQRSMRCVSFPYPSLHFQNITLPPSLSAGAWENGIAVTKAVSSRTSLIQGMTSGAGKCVLAAGLCRALGRRNRRAVFR